MALEQAGLDLAANGAAAFISSVKGSTSAVRDFAGETINAEKISNKITGTISGLASVLGTGLKIAATASAAAIAGVAAGMGSAVKQTIDWANKLDSMGDVLGTTTAENAALALAVESVGGSAEQFTNQLAFMARGLKDAKGKTGPTGKAIQSLGVSFENADGSLRSVNDIVADVSSKIAAMPDGLEKTALQMDIFGKSGKDLTDVMNALADGGLDEAGKRAKALGLVLSDETMDAIIQMQIQIKEIQQAFLGFATTIGNFVIPVIADLVSRFHGFINDLAADILPVIQDLGGDFLDGFNEGGLLAGIANLFDRVGDVITNEVDWSSIGSRIATGIGNAVTSATGVGVAIGKWILEKLSEVDWNAVGTKVLEQIKLGIDAAKTTVGGIGNSIIDWIIASFSSTDWSAAANSIFTLLSGAVTSVSPTAIAALIAGILLPTPIDIATATIITLWGDEIYIALKTAFESQDWGKLGGDVLALINQGIAQAGAIAGPIFPELKIPDSIAETLPRVGEAFANFVQKISEQGPQVVDILERLGRIAEKLAPVVEFLVNAFLIFVEHVLPVLALGVENAIIKFDSLLAGIEAILDLGRFLDELEIKWHEFWLVTLPNALAAAGQAFGAQVDLWFNGPNGIIAQLAGFWDNIKIAAETAWRNIVFSITTIFNGITSGIKSTINGVIDTINGLIGSFNALPDPFPNFPFIPRLAAGTDYWKGGIAEVGHGGTELVSLPEGSKVYPAATSAQIMNTYSYAYNNEYNMHLSVTPQQAMRVSRNFYLMQAAGI